MHATLPDPRPRPRLARLLFERDLPLTAAAEQMDIPVKRLSRLLRPFDDDDRRRPTDEELARIVAYTGGAITAADFYPPHLNGEPDRGGRVEVLAGARAS